MAKQNAGDLFMNFLPISVMSVGNATTLCEAEFNTGLSIRGGMAWLIHKIEWHIPVTAIAASATIKLALSTRKGLATMPALKDDGVVDYVEQTRVIATGVGFQSVRNPLVNPFLPPVPIASPQLSMYFQASIDDASLRNIEYSGRICFTTAPLDNAMYTEIAETWGW